MTVAQAVDAAGALPGHGPARCSTCAHQLPVDAYEMPTDDARGAPADHGRRASSPGPHAGSQAVDLDHTDPFVPLAAGGPTGADPGRQPRADGPVRPPGQDPRPRLAAPTTQPRASTCGAPPRLLVPRRPHRHPRPRPWPDPAVVRVSRSHGPAPCPRRARLRRPARGSANPLHGGPHARRCRARMRRIGLIGGRAGRAPPCTPAAQPVRRPAARRAALRGVRAVSGTSPTSRRMQVDGRWDEAGDRLADAAGGSQVAGADVWCCARTPCTRSPTASGRRPGAVAPHRRATAERSGAEVGTVGLLGTAFTMEQPFLRERSRPTASGVLVPDAADRRWCTGSSTTSSAGGSSATSHARR